MLCANGLAPRPEPVFAGWGGFDLKSDFPEPSGELPKTEEGGGSAGVNDPTEEGGGPAGVVEGFEGRPLDKCPNILVCL